MSDAGTAASNSSAKDAGKPGGSARRRGRGSASEQTRSELIMAAITTVVEHGLGGATARQIATAAAANQASIYYHFGSVDGLLVAALVDSSERRLVAYHQRLDPLTDPDAILGALDQLHDDDIASGHLTFTAEMVAGVAAHSELREAVVAAITPWTLFIAETIRRVANDGGHPLLALPADLLADLVMSVVIGSVLRSNLDGDHERYFRYVNFARLVIAALNVQIGSTPNPSS